MLSDVILKIEKKEFETIPSEIRVKFKILKVEPQDYELHWNDETFVELNREYKKSSKKLRNYLFNKRNK